MTSSGQPLAVAASQQQFLDDFYGWCLGLSFVIVMTLIVGTMILLYNDIIENPFGPLIRYVESWQAHRQQLSVVKSRVKAAKSGVDPSYITYLESRNEIGR